jgi:hypothetical protein
MAAFFQKNTSVAAINITLGVPGRRADKRSIIARTFFVIQKLSAAEAGVLLKQKCFLKKSSARGSNP